MSEIVVGYDGTECSAAALEFACELAKQTGDALILAFGYEPYHAGGEVAPLRNSIKEIGEKATAEGVARARELGLEAEAALVGDRPAPALASVAEERGARMIAVGSYGEAPIKGAILGTTPHKLLHLTTVPVIVVPAGD